MSLLSKATVGAVGLLCKTFLNIGYCSSVTIHGFDNLREALESSGRTVGCGVVTNRLFSFFFRHGQVIETFRGKGIFQPAVDDAIEKLNGGAWIHLFGEGKVNQPATDPAQDPAKLLRFKWGVGRIVMETANTPVIIPMWLTGFDRLMPEGRSFPWKFIPRPRISLSVTFGKPIDANEIRNALHTHRATPGVSGSTSGGLSDPRRPHEEQKSSEISRAAWLGEAANPELLEEPGRDTVAAVATVRSAVTALLQHKVEELGREVRRTQDTMQPPQSLRRTRHAGPLLASQNNHRALEAVMETKSQMPWGMLKTDTMRAILKDLGLATYTERREEMVQRLQQVEKDGLDAVIKRLERSQGGGSGARNQHARKHKLGGEGAARTSLGSRGLVHKDSKPIFEGVVLPAPPKPCRQVFVGVVMPSLPRKMRRTSLKRRAESDDEGLQYGSLQTRRKGRRTASFPVTNSDGNEN
ncbi:predicted protein [Postia placenta Mad-698-R]|nr:predicted protein [Postia placenta Mad-698-R]